MSSLEEKEWVLITKFYNFLSFYIRRKGVEYPHHKDNEGAEKKTDLRLKPSRFRLFTVWKFCKSSMNDAVTPIQFNSIPLEFLFF